MKLISYFYAFMRGFLVFFITGIAITLVLQLLGDILYQLRASVNPHPISISLSIKYSFWPSLLYGFYGIYYKWDRRKQTSRPPRKRHPHD